MSRRAGRAHDQLVGTEAAPVAEQVIHWALPSTSGGLVCAKNGTRMGDQLSDNKLHVEEAPQCEMRTRYKMLREEAES